MTDEQHQKVEGEEEFVPALSTLYADKEAVFKNVEVMKQRLAEQGPPEPHAGYRHIISFNPTKVGQSVRGVLLVDPVKKHPIGTTICTSPVVIARPVDNDTLLVTTKSGSHYIVTYMGVLQDITELCGFLLRPGVLGVDKP